MVLGAAAGDVISRAELPGATVLRNEAWQTGMASSLRAGLSALRDTDAAAVVVLLVDTPGIGAAAVRRVAACAAGNAVAVATYDGQRGHPVLLGRDHWAEVIRTANGDAGAREFLATHPGLVRLVPCDDIAQPCDVDVPADLPGELSH